MQVWMPHPSMRRSLMQLDDNRLNAQRREAALAIRCARGELSGGYSNHPAGRAFARRIAWLKKYHNVALREWVGRGHRNSMPHETGASDASEPWFIGHRWLHYAHRSVLQKKKPEHYGAWDPNTASSMYLELLEKMGETRPLMIYPCGIGCYWQLRPVVGQRSLQLYVSMNLAAYPGWALELTPQRTRSGVVRWARSWDKAAHMGFDGPPGDRQVLFFRFPRDGKFIRAIPLNWKAEV